MNTVGQSERKVQNRVIKLFQNHLGYIYDGNRHERENNKNVERNILTQWLEKQEYSATLIKKAIDKIENVAFTRGGQRTLYNANEDVYRILRYGAKVQEDISQKTQTVWLIDWNNPENNLFSIAEEVTLRENNEKRPDIVVYVNGIALAVIELKRSSTDVAKAIRQNLENQNEEFIRSFFTTIQLVIAGNDSQGLRYGSIETPEKHYYLWSKW